MNRTKQDNLGLLNRALRRVFGDRKLAESLNTERSLQCALYSALVEMGSEGTTQRILVEPTVDEFTPKEAYRAKLIPDLLVVRPFEGNDDHGTIDIGIELKMKPSFDVVFEKDISKLIAYRNTQSVPLHYGIDLDTATMRTKWFDIDKQSTVWAFVAIGQSASVVAVPQGIIVKCPGAEGIIASCLVARSKIKVAENMKPGFWVHELGDNAPLKWEDIK